MKKCLMVTFFLSVHLSLWVAATPCRAEEKFPAKAITLVVGFNAGGGADILARALAEDASKTLGQPVVVMNKPGAGSAVSLGELKNAKPDGYSLAILSSTGVIGAATMGTVTYHPVNDFDAILQMNQNIAGFAVRADSPFKSMKDLISYAQANPRKITYATSGAGTPGNLTMVRLGNLLSIKWTNVPFGGGLEAASAVLGGHVDGMSQTGEWKPLVLAGRLRLIATYGPKRIQEFPDVPTLIEMGYNMTAPTTSCIVGPKGIPKDRLKILHDAFHKAMDTRAVKDSFEKFGMMEDYLNSHDTEIRIKEIYETTKALGIIEKQ